MTRIITLLSLPVLLLTLGAPSCQPPPTTSGPEATETAAATPAAAVAAGPATDTQFPDMVPYVPRNLPSGACVSEAVLDADQFIHLHTELMVTGLTCHGAYAKPNLFGDYARFTANHAGRVRDVQNVMGRFLSQHQGGNSQRLFDSYRTKAANDEALTVNRVSASAYCAAHKQLFEDASTFTAAELDAYLEEATARYRDVYPVCGEASAE